MRPSPSIFLLRFRYLIAVPPTISPIPDKTVNETDNLTLPCVATGVPSPFVSWVKVSSGQRTNGSLLQLTNISRSQFGKYRCEASNECGNAVETVNITVPCKLQSQSCTRSLARVISSCFAKRCFPKYGFFSLKMSA